MFNHIAFIVIGIPTRSESLRRFDEVQWLRSRLNAQGTLFYIGLQYKRQCNLYISLL